ncbi:MAG TPA: hypothetical protein VHL80_15795 [Polyangia bacterium]|nr:hypothetical protein [Polyangia bacterium]
MRAHVLALVALGLAALACSSSKPKGADADADGAPPPDAEASGAAGADAAADLAPTPDADAAADRAAAPDADAAAEASGAGGALGMAGPNDVLTRNGSETRQGFFIQPRLTFGALSKMGPDTGFQASFTGSMYASPLYVENGPRGKGAFFAATTSNVVYALDETTGAVLWMHAIGEAPAVTGAGCGNVKPVGITSTPVIDPRTRTIFVAGGVGTTQIDRHEIHALSLDDGAERAGWPVNVSALQDPTGLAFNTVAQNQRSALSLVNGVLYVAYGGHAGDCNTYHGWIVAVDTTSPTRVGAWATGGVGEGIWAAGGMASDGTSVFAATGNRLPDGATHQDSEEIVRVTGLAQVDRSTGVFYPASWRTMDQQDQDMASSSPVVLTVPGATPATIVAAASKDGHLFLLDPKNLGGMGAPLLDLRIATTDTIRSPLSAYVSPAGAHVLVNTLAGGPCSPTVPSLASYIVTPTNPPKLDQAWCFASGSNGGAIATTSDGTHDPVVWVLNGGINAINGDVGTLVYNGLNGPCLGAHAFSAPIAVKGRIIASADNRLCSWSSH